MGIKCRHCGFVLQRANLGRDKRDGHKYGGDTVKFVTCSRCEGRRVPREGEQMRADFSSGKMQIGKGGDYRAEVQSINERTRTALVKIETERGYATARIPYEHIEKKCR